MKYLKFIIILVVIFALFLIPSFLYSNNNEFYQEIQRPFFSPPSWVFGVVWTSIYFLIALATTIIATTDTDESKCKYYIILAINYFLIQSFTPVFFGMESLYGGFIITTLTALASIFLYVSAKKISKPASWLLIPYVLWTMFATVLAGTIYMINT